VSGNGKVRCGDCWQWVRQKNDGGLYRHHDPERNGFVCNGWAATAEDESRRAVVSDPAPTVESMDDVVEKGPWFGAMYDGECSECDGAIFEGDRIRADGTGGYECEDCGDETLTHPVTAKASVVEIRTPAAPGPMPTPDEFMSPSPVGTPQPVLSVSGQPKQVERDYLGRYAVVLPGETELEVFKSSGKPVGRTRVTTFVKAASDNKAINDWGKRNVVIGAARRRDLILQANELTHEKDRDKLNSLVLELEAAAGAKVGSDLGTFLHEFTEYMDAGEKTWQDAPPEFQRSLALYAQALADAGLEPIRSLIERTTIIREFGWVCGTFDRIFYHRPSGQYVIGDLKTGKTMAYGKNEIEAQLWTYAHGVNQNGIYDWHTRTWSDPLLGLGLPGPEVPRGQGVSEKVGVVIHMPVQGPDEGTVKLLWADLENGARYAALCDSVRSFPGGRMAPWGDGPAAPVSLTWEDRFRAVRTAEEATALWRLARAEGVDGVRLNEFIAIARESLVKG